MTVFQYIDAHPGLPQGCVVQYFKTKPQDALEFTHNSISKTKGRTVGAPLTIDEILDPSVEHVNADYSFDIIHNLRRLRGVLRREEIQNAKQATRDPFWNMKVDYIPLTT